MTAAARRTDPVPEPPNLTHALNRSHEMQLLHEDLARAHSAQLLADAVRSQRNARLVAALRAQRRAERASARARRLLSLAVAR
jgi:hypothetical protein